MMNLIVFICILLCWIPFADGATTPPSRGPTRAPSRAPSRSPSMLPSVKPSLKPSIKPTLIPSRKPSALPSILPTSVPTSHPTSYPTSHPSFHPTSHPTSHPSSHPTSRPTSTPTRKPTPQPSNAPVVKSSSSSSSLAPGAVAGIIIAVFVVVAAGLYFGRRHYHYIQRFINLSGLSGYGFLDDKQERMAASSPSGGGVEDGLQFSSVSNPLVPEEVNGYESSAANIVPFGGSASPPRHNATPESPSAKKRKNSFDDHEVMEHVLGTGLAKAGFLMKLSTHGAWKKRYFFVKDGKLYYTHKQLDESAKKGVSAVMVANLLISTVRNPSGKDFQIISPGQRGNGTGGGVYELMADSEEDAADWVDVIRQQIEGSLTSNLPVSNEAETDAKSYSSTKFVPGPLILKEIRANNPNCADCNAANPDWASLNLCLLMCIECSGIHRSLGSHISKVRSITLDKWSNNSIKLLNMIGNAGANSIWEETLSKSQNPAIPNAKINLINPKSDRETRETFIDNKYVKKAYISHYGIPDVNIDIEELLAGCKSGDCHGVMRYLAQGISVNSVSSVVGAGDEAYLRTPLMTAVANGQVLCVELLCQWGADLDAVDDQGRTALDIAKVVGNQAIIDILFGFSAPTGVAPGSPGQRKGGRQA